MKTFKELINEGRIKDITKDYSSLSKKISKVMLYPSGSAYELVFSFTDETTSNIEKLLKKMETSVKKNFKVLWYVDEPDEWGEMNTSKGTQYDVKFRVKDK